jgi:hypothetical protein
LTRSRAIAYALLGATAALTFACFAPGHINIDSLSQIQEVDRWAFTNRHATMLLALWAPLYAIGVGPGFVLAAQIAAFALGAYLVLRVAFDRVPAAAIVAFVCFWPPVFGMLGSLGRDTWFAALMISTYGLLGRAGQREWPSRGRWLALAALALWLALASRQNAFPAMVPAAVALAAMALPPLAERGRRWASALVLRPVLGALGAGIAIVVAMGATQLAGAKLAGAEDVDPEQYLYIYDLAALSEREGENLFPPDVARERGLEPIETGFRVDSMVDLVYFQPPFVPTPLAPGPAASLREAWLDRATGDPPEYLAVRGELFGRQLALTRNARYVFIPEVIENQYGYAIWFGGLNAAALDYLAAFTEPQAESIFFAPINGGPLHAVWAYLLVAAAAAGVLLRRGRPTEEVAVGALALAALLLQVGLFPLAMGTEYRFEFPAVAAAMLSAAVAAASAVRSRTSARTRPESAARPGRW